MGSGLAIWGYAFGYFTAYVPYSALTKALSDGRLAGMSGGVPGFELLPVTTLASLAGMMLFLGLSGWWRFAGRVKVGGLSLPAPGKWTFLSGLCTAAIIGTTTLAYTVTGASIVLMMLLMRGGVLAIGPLVDFLTRRRVQWVSWVALALSLAALLVPFSTRGGLALTAWAVVDVVVYLLAYFIRLRFMSRLAKSDDELASRRYFVEEQLVAAPAVVLVLAVAALVGQGDVATLLRHGFTTFFDRGVTELAILVGLCSQGTGIFGGLILLDRRENTFCVPVNRASSVLAGVLATYSLAWFLGTRTPASREIGGAALIIAAIAVLAWPSIRTRLSRS